MDMDMDMDMDNKQYIFKNGGFPPIKYCTKIEIVNPNTTKERLFANSPRQNINIRQLLNESTIKKQLFIPDIVSEDIIEVVTSL
jgi:hypothetical protein